jgi:hypothetical protein
MQTSGDDDRTDKQMFSNCVRYWLRTARGHTAMKSLKFALVLRIGGNMPVRNP